MKKAASWIAILFLLALINNVIGSAGHDRSTTECLDCHPDQISKQVSHFMTSSDDCQFCHELSGETGQLEMTTVTDNSSCVACHIQNDILFDDGAHVEMLCTDCHAAHGSDFQTLYVSAETSLCFQNCHGDADMGLSHPVGDGIEDIHAGSDLSCVSTCHSIHQPTQPKMLQVASLDLCMRCHSEKF
ncbi:MAG: cytochrome c3 family protein [candidate division Zixibacteria bacterium]